MLDDGKYFEEWPINNNQMYFEYFVRNIINFRNILLLNLLNRDNFKQKTTIFFSIYSQHFL